MPEVREFTYTKANGEQSHRRVIILRKPQTNYLGLDVTDMTEMEIAAAIDNILEADKYRDEYFEEYSSRWRTFKPEGIEWLDK